MHSFFGLMGLLPILAGLFNLIIFIVAIYFIYQWVTRFISLKEEQNEILREISRKLEKNE